jgi:hypothetical protein
MSNRHQRRADLHDFRRASALWTFLCAPDDARLSSAPLLQQTASRWLDLLSKRVRFCIICNSWLVGRQDVGLLLLATPATIRPTSASCCGVCHGCADADLPLEALERAAERALRAALPNGRLAPLETRR